MVGTEAHSVRLFLRSVDLSPTGGSVVVLRIVVEVVLHLGRGHQTEALFVGMDMDDILQSHLHALLLLAKRAEQVFHHAPMEERTILVDPRTLQIRKLIHAGERLLGRGDGSLLLVEIDEDAQRVAHLRALGHILVGHEDFSVASAIEVKAKALAFALTISHFLNSQVIVIAEFYFDHLC